jgi:aryl-alcohol dehydrogenase
MIVSAAVCWGPGGPFEYSEVELDEPRPDELVVRLVATGVCHTDINSRDGRTPTQFPIILGHEGAGVVEQVGSAVRDVEPGQRVLLLPDYCGRCPACVAGRSKYCDYAMPMSFSGRRLDGTPRAHRDGVEIGACFFGQSSFATHALATERNVLAVPADAPLERLTALTCGIQTGAGAALHAIPVRVGSTLLVFGAGAVGLSAVMIAAAAGAAEIVVVDRVSHRLELARELGATHVIDTTAVGSELGTAIRAHRPAGYDAVIDTTGVPELIGLGVDSLATGGTCGVITTAGGDLVISPRALLTRGASIRGIIGGDAPSKQLVPELIALNERGAFPYERLIRHYRFDQLNDAVADSVSGRTIKPVLLF